MAYAREKRRDAMPVVGAILDHACVARRPLQPSSVSRRSSRACAGGSGFNFSALRSFLLVRPRRRRGQQFRVGPPAGRAAADRRIHRQDHCRRSGSRTLFGDIAYWYYGFFRWLAASVRYDPDRADGDVVRRDRRLSGLLSRLAQSGRQRLDLFHFSPFCRDRAHRAGDRLSR